MRRGEVRVIALVKLDDSECGNKTCDTEQLDCGMYTGAVEFLCRRYGWLNDERGLDLQKNRGDAEHLFGGEEKVSLILAQRIYLCLTGQSHLPGVARKMTAAATKPLTRPTRPTGVPVSELMAT